MEYSDETESLIWIFQCLAHTLCMQQGLVTVPVCVCVSKLHCTITLESVSGHNLVTFLGDWFYMIKFWDTLLEYWQIIMLINVWWFCSTMTLHCNSFSTFLQHICFLEQNICVNEKLKYFIPNQVLPTHCYPVKYKLQ